MLYAHNDVVLHSAIHVLLKFFCKEPSSFLEEFLRMFRKELLSNDKAQNPFLL